MQAVNKWAERSKGSREAKVPVAIMSFGRNIILGQ